MGDTDISAFASEQLSLLDSELQAELEETQLLTATHAPVTLQRAGLAVLNLNVSSQRTGFGGKTLLELGLDPAVGGGELLEHGLRVGDICAVAEQPKGAERKKEREGMEKRGAEGVVTKVQKELITVALDKEDVDVPSGKLWLYVNVALGKSGHKLTNFMPFQCQACQRCDVQATQPEYDQVAEDAAVRVQYSHPGSVGCELSNAYSR